MYSLIHKLGLFSVMKKEALSFILALTIAEFLYKFGSFILECSAFLVTWYLLGGIMKYISDTRKKM
ncbi:MAG: hypothetical protein ABIY62_08025 [Ginsengibacter sp.]